jgi:hypothetical protein
MSDRSADGTTAPARHWGVPIKTSPLIPEDQIVRIGGEVWFHSRISARGRTRRKHGRPRNAPRRLKVRFVRYQPALDKVLATGGSDD